MKLNRFVAVKYSLEKLNLYTMKLSEKGPTGRIMTAQIATGQKYLTTAQITTSLLSSCKKIRLLF